MSSKRFVFMFFFIFSATTALAASPLSASQDGYSYDNDNGYDCCGYDYGCCYNYDCCYDRNCYVDNGSCCEGYCPKLDDDGYCNGKRGIWFPEAPWLFKPFMADPRQVTASAGWRFHDSLFDKNLIDVSYADYFPIYRWCDVGPWHGRLQFSLEGGLYALFEPTRFSAPLVDADYFVGGSFNYIAGKWSFRLRGYHISTHLGDEFLLNEQIENPAFRRLNPSSEYLEFDAAYQITCNIRLYAGIGDVLTDSSSMGDTAFPAKGPYFEAGAEQYFDFGKFRSYSQNVVGKPFHALHIRSVHFTPKRYRPSFTYVAGYELKKLCGLSRAFRIFFQYHNGYSREGQFQKNFTNYYSIRFSYGF